MIILVSIIITLIILGIIIGPYAKKRDFEGDGLGYKTYLKNDDD